MGMVFDLKPDRRDFYRVWLKLLSLSYPFRSSCNIPNLHVQPDKWEWQWTCTSA